MTILSDYDHNHARAEAAIETFIGKPKAVTRVELVSLDTVMNRTVEIDFVIEGLREANTKTFDVGKWGGGKSFRAVHEACCIVTGTRYGERPVKQGPVVFIVGEGFSGLSRRFTAWEMHHGIALPRDQMLFTTTSVPLDRAEAATAAHDAISKAADGWGRPPIAIYVDTLARNFEGKENDNDDMGRYITNIERHLQQPFESAVVSIHHPPRTEGQGGRPRGASAIDGGADAIFTIEKHAETPHAPDWKISYFVEKPPKDFDAPAPEWWEFKRLVIGERTTLDGDVVPVTSGILTPIDAPADAVDKGLGGAQQAMLEILKEELSKSEYTLAKTGLPIEGARVSVKEWQRLGAKAGHAKSRQRFYKIRDSLQERGLIRIDGIYVWPISQDNTTTGVNA